MRISNTRMNGRSARWMRRFAADCARCYANRKSDPALAGVMQTINAGRIHSSRKLGCSPCTRCGLTRDNPDEETTDWRAVCGKTARTVRREGRAGGSSLPLSDNYKTHAVGQHLQIRLCPLRGVVLQAGFRPPYRGTGQAPQE